MRFNTKILGIAGLVVALIIIVIWVTRPRTHELEQPPQSEVTNSEQVVATQPSHSLFSPEQPLPPSVSSEEPPREIPTTNTNAVSNWEEKIDEVLTEDSESDQKAKKLLAIFPKLPEEGQVEAAKHIVNLLPDENYAQINPYVTDPALPPEVLDELVADLLNRPDSIKLPMLLKIAQNPQHPDASEAKDILEIYLDEDYGNDWGKWSKKLAEWLKDHPD